MGADTFEHWSRGKNAQEAFDKAVEQAYWDHGHAGYTGTICEKDSFNLFRLPEGLSVKQAMGGFHNWYHNVEEPTDPKHLAFIEQMIVDVDDKWGPAGCIEDVSGREPDGTRLYCFFGWASS